MTIMDGIDDLKRSWIRSTEKLQTNEFQQPIRDALQDASDGINGFAISLQKSWQDAWKATPRSQQVDQQFIQEPRRGLTTDPRSIGKDPFTTI